MDVGVNYSDWTALARKSPRDAHYGEGVHDGSPVPSSRETEDSQRLVFLQRDFERTTLAGSLSLIDDNDDVVASRGSSACVVTHEGPQERFAVSRVPPR